MRYFIVPAALTLTACSLPGLSGMSIFTTATQEHCASRGLALDTAGKQCVTSAALQEPETTGSLPSQAGVTEKPSSSVAHLAPAQPTAQQPQPQQPPVQPQEPLQKRASLSVPIEPDAVIKPDSSQNSETATEYAHIVRAGGYRCDSVSALTPRSGGVTLVCNRSALRYAIKDKDKDGHWIVTIE